MISGKSNSQDSFVDSQNQFALKIYNQTKPENANFFISPLSINIALAIANEGAKGETKAELSKLLGFKNSNHVSDSYHSLIVRLQFLNDTSVLRRGGFSNNVEYKPGNNHLDICNSLWYNKKYNLNPVYLQKVQNNYLSEGFEYNDNELGNINTRINKWVRAKTNNKISSLPATIDEQTRLTILNATYFIAEWENKFDKKNTKKRRFKSINHSSGKIDFMFRHADMKYYEDDDIQAITIPYKGNMLSMFIILPTKKYGLPSIESKLDLEYFNKILSSLKKLDVELYIPKFRIESELSLVKPLQVLGLKSAFDSLADFSLIDSTKKVWIGEVLHKTFIETDEEKTEAAALSEISVIAYGAGKHKPPPPPKLVDMDHPFLFCIIDNWTNGILFMGKYIKTNHIGISQEEAADLRQNVKESNP